MRTAAQRAIDASEPSVRSAAVSTTTPLTVTVPSLDGGREKFAVRGYPAHPAGRPPAPRDACVVALDELSRLWITSWEAS